MNIENLLFSCTLPQLEKKDYNWNCRCIVCGDSKKTQSKKRFWILKNKKHDGYNVFCHNCGYSNSLISFLKTYFPDVYKEYIRLRFKKKKESIELPKPKKKIIIPKINLSRVTSLPEDHISHKFFKNRLIPTKWKRYLFYSDNFQKWINTKIPDKFKKIPKFDKRIIIPFYDINRKLFAVTGRALYKTDLRYVTIKFDDDVPKIFGLERVDFNKTIYVFEGPIDSLFFPNSIAMAGSISGLVKLLDYSDVSNFILVPDLEPRNKEILKFIEKSLKIGFKVSLLPKWMKKYGKDINDYILGGMTRKQVYDIINENIIDGKSGLTKFKFWREIK